MGSQGPWVGVGGEMREEIVTVVSAPPGSPVAHTYSDLGSAIRDSFPATVGRGGEDMTRGNCKWRGETDMKPDRVQ